MDYTYLSNSIEINNFELILHKRHDHFFLIHWGHAAFSVVVSETENILIFIFPINTFK